MAIRLLSKYENYSHIDFNFIISDYLLELLNRLEPIKPDENYVNDYYNFTDATDKNIENYSDCPVFNELKSDMEGFCKDICNELKQLPEVETAFVERSNRVGISTYVTVKLKHPKDCDTTLDYYNNIQDKRFINLYDSGIAGQGNGLSGEYVIKFRVSTHRPGSSGTQVHYDIDVTNKAYKYFKDKIINHIEDRITYVKQAWKNYKEYGIFPNNQAERNRSRAEAKKQHKAWKTEIFTKNSLEKYLTESKKYLSIGENLVTDLKFFGITIPKQIIRNIPYDIDIQNCNVQQMDDINIKGKFVIIANHDNEIVALWNKDRYCYNPNKLKVSDIKNYICYEVVNNSGSVLPKRKERQDLRKGYVDLAFDKTFYNKPPKSTRYVFDKDWNPNVNREYYTKLLHQNKLGQYAQQLDYAYTIMEDLIAHRRAEQTVGKKAVYTNWIKKLASSIESAELLMDALDKNVNPDIPKLLRSLKSLERVTTDAYKFIGYEDDAIKTWGYTKQRKPIKIER